MAEKIWKVEKINYCEHVSREVELQAQVVFPSETLPDQPPRILAHRCSNSLECNLIEKATCVLCGTNPDLNLV